VGWATVIAYDSTRLHVFEFARKSPFLMVLSGHELALSGHLVRSDAKSALTLYTSSTGAL
jgi:hypothetical protein